VTLYCTLNTKPVEFALSATRRAPVKAGKTLHADVALERDSTKLHSASSMAGVRSAAVRD
jgi:hypothetical protein